MEYSGPVQLDILIEPWPIAKSLCESLPVADLITLGRTSAALRASLHGYGRPEIISKGVNSTNVRDSLNIGFHNTPYWQRLKELAPFECCSKSHTRGPPPRPCRYCSRPICEACIVRSSFARRNQNTFKNRCRYLCKNCWSSGNLTKSRRLPLQPNEELVTQQAWDSGTASSKDFCCCTLKNDGWLCLECKDKQNEEAIDEEAHRCYGEGCSNELEEDGESRKICLWCDKPLPKVGGTTRYAWNQKIIEARARNAASRQADLEEYNRKRLKLLRMSRRELRGNDAVKGDPEADLPQFIRHLDTMNYRRYMSEAAAPSGDAVYASKLGYWRYSRDFLLAVRYRCIQSPVSEYLRQVTRENGFEFSRTNLEKSEQISQMQKNNSSNDLTRQSSSTSLSRPNIFGLNSSCSQIPISCQNQATEWFNLKPSILEAFIVQKLEFDDAKMIMIENYDFEAPNIEFLTMFRFWGYNQQDLNLSETNKSKLEESFRIIDDMDIVPCNPTQPGLERQISQVSTSNDSSEDSISLLDDVETRQNKRKGFRRMSQLKFDLRSGNSRERRSKQLGNSLSVSRDDLILGQCVSGPVSPSETSAAQPHNNPPDFVDAYVSPPTHTFRDSAEEQGNALEPAVDPTSDGIELRDIIGDVPEPLQDSEEDPPPYAPGEWVWREPE